jgi:hypothetical protein
MRGIKSGIFGLLTILSLSFVSAATTACGYQSAGFVGYYFMYLNWIVVGLAIIALALFLNLVRQRKISFLKKIHFKFVD